MTPQAWIVENSVSSQAKLRELRWSPLWNERCRRQKSAYWDCGITKPQEVASSSSKRFISTFHSCPLLHSIVFLPITYLHSNESPSSYNLPPSFTTQQLRLNRSAWSEPFQTLADRFWLKSIFQTLMTDAMASTMSWVLRVRIPINANTLYRNQEIEALCDSRSPTQLHIAFTLDGEEIQLFHRRGETNTSKWNGPFIFDWGPK